MRIAVRYLLMAASVLCATTILVGPAAAAPGPSASERVIVLLTGTPQGTAGTRQRFDAVRAAQAPVLAELAGARDTHSFSVLDAMAATVTPQQESRLRADPRVAEVVPDAAIRLVPPAHVSGGAKTGGLAPNPPPGACAAAGAVQLDPEAVTAINAVSDNPASPTARGLGATGAGVTVGDIAGSIDVRTPELIRSDGSAVISDYRDFTGEGSAAVSEDLESFLDDGMIAAQGRDVYDLANYTVHKLPQPCQIRLVGVAPEVKLTAYKVYGANDLTTTSAFLEAIDYAVDVDHVNVLNEEAGSFPMPDTSADLIKTANEDAMAAGVTITVPSYDSGMTNTIWSPASQPGVISVGASTTFRSYAQADGAGFQSIGAHGWLSDNISSLSSGGATEQGRSIDVVAPGDLDWAICTADARIAPDCLDERGQPSGFTLSGGTSEAGPLVAGVAALVIQSYRATHGGTTPAPALVGHLITSTADDLEVPGAQQGAGLVDAYRAVAAARSMPGNGATPAAIGSNVVADTDQLDAIGAPGSASQFSVTITNAGATRQTVAAQGRTLGTQKTIASANPVLNATDPSYVDASGYTRIYTTVPFTVPPGMDRLAGDIAYPGANQSVVDLTLLDPNGNMAGYSLPQGQGNHGHADVREPSPGVWRAIIAATQTVPGKINGYTGPVRFHATAASNGPFGTVTPSQVSLDPGASATLKVTARLPAQPGDSSASLVLRVPNEPANSIPMTLRSLVRMAGGVGRFSADLAGGNGRTGTPAQTFFYNVDVPAGQPALDVRTTLAHGAQDPYYCYLIAPDGQTAAQSSNQLLVGMNNGAPVTVGGPGALLHALNPAAGRWTVLITFTNPVSGDALSTPLAGVVDFAPITPTVSDLPEGEKLAAGSAHVVSVTVHNDTSSVESYFLDARRPIPDTFALQSITPSQHITLPLPVTAQIPQWIVPTNTTAIYASATASVPVMFDSSPYNGEPDLGSVTTGNQSFAALTAPDITPGDWQITPQPVGDIGAQPMPPSTASLSFTVTTAAFDTDTQSPSGDLWRPGSNFAPVVVQPGQSATLHLTITPSAAVGTVVAGTLYLDDSISLSQYGLDPTGDQLVALPYRYTVG